MRTPQKQQQRHRFFGEPRRLRINNREACAFFGEAAIGFIAGFATGYMKFCSGKMCDDLRNIPFHMHFLYSFIPMISVINYTGYVKDNDQNLDFNDAKLILKNTVTPYAFGIFCGGLLAMRPNTYTNDAVEMPELRHIMR